MEIKLEFDTEKNAKAAVATASAFGLCRVSRIMQFPQLAAANAITLIIIIAILYSPRPSSKKTD